MKQFLTFILLMLISLQLFAQKHDKQIKQDIEQMYKYVRNNQTEKVLNLTYPKIFEIMPKEQMKSLVSKDGMSKALGMNIKDTFYDNVKVTEKHKVGNGKVALASYDSEMTVDLDEDMKEMVELATQMGVSDPSVPKFEKTESGDYKLKGKSYSAAIQDEHTNGKWNYLNVNFNKKGKIDLPDNVLSKDYKEALEKLYKNIK